MVNKPTWYSFDITNKPPGLFFVEDVKYREDYTRTVVKKLGGLTCVMIVNINETDSPIEIGNIYNSFELPLGRKDRFVRFFSTERTVFRYESVYEFEKIIGN